MSFTTAVIVIYKALHNNELNTHTTCSFTVVEMKSPTEFMYFFK